MNVQFAPAVAGAVSGELTVVSNSSTNGTSVVALSGTGVSGVAVAVSPLNAAVPANATQQFTASVVGTQDTDVAWTATGSGCSGTACGTISSSGLYTAPTSVPSSSPTVIITASSAADSTQFATSIVTIAPPVGTTYYMAANGSDGNNGLSAGSPWASPNHALHCGDEIVAAPGSYAPENFQWNFGTVTGTGHCVARMTCQTFDACKISFPASNDFGMAIQTSHWMVDGWEVTAAGKYGICFEAYPSTSSASMQDIVFANDIANGCEGGGFSPVSNPPAGADYFALISDISYNAAQATGACSSGISIWEPINSDTAPGTHMYISQTFTWGNVEPAVCANGPATDGEGIILDTWNQWSYSGQAVIENNLTFYNNGMGIEVFENSEAPIYVRNNTSASNDTSAVRSTGLCGEIGGSQGTTTTQFYQNVARASSATACMGNDYYAFVLQDADDTAQINSNFGYGEAGNDFSCQTCTTFLLGSNNIFGTDPMFANLPSSTPAAPSCGSATSVVNCMAPMVADFTPTSTAVPAGWGYQAPSSTDVSDSLFPQWLCGIGLPSGWVTNGCLTGTPSSNAIAKQDY